MKLSVSNIGWTQQQDGLVYEMMKKYGFEGLEIAPTRIFPEDPYAHRQQGGKWSRELKETYGFQVSSMQSIWFGRQERLFGSREEEQALLDYTKKAIDFAQAVGCGNLVFGCPRNRVISEMDDPQRAVYFFRELGEYAAARETVLAMEANPPIYNTNYINDTPSALELIRQVDSKGFLLNLDTGTMIQNQETVCELKGAVRYVNHVHLSEPGLKPLEKRDLHKELLDLLATEQYQGFVSIEMGKQEELSALEEAIRYVKEIAG